MKHLVSLSSNLFWYGLRARPADIGTVPIGYSKILTQSECEVSPICMGTRPNSYRWGAVAYDTPLPQSQIDGYELVPLSKVVEPDFSKFGHDQGTKKATLEWVGNQVLDILAKQRIKGKLSVLTKMASIKVPGVEVKYGIKGDSLAVAGYSSMMFKIRNKRDADEAAFEIALLIEDSL